MIADSPNLFTQPRSEPKPPAAPALATPPTHDGGRLASNPEEDAKDRVLQLHNVIRRRILTRLREAMVKLYKQRREHQGADAFVTADDARVVLESDPDVPSAKELNRNFMGSLFSMDKTNKKPNWEWTGKYVKSRTAGSNANPLKCWRWVGWRNSGGDA